MVTVHAEVEIIRTKVITLTKEEHRRLKPPSWPMYTLAAIGLVLTIGCILWNEISSSIYIVGLIIGLLSVPYGLAAGILESTRQSHLLRKAEIDPDLDVWRFEVVD